MTTKDLMIAVIDASEVGTPKLACYEPAITQATMKGGITTITRKIRVADFTPNDVLHGMHGWLLIGTKDALLKLSGGLL